MTNVPEKLYHLTEKGKRVAAELRNRHPVDELYDIRQEIQDLKKMEKRLRDKIISGTCSLYGDQYEAVICNHERHIVDVDAIRREMGPEWVRRFMKITTVTVVRTTTRDALDDAYQD
jgi:Mn-dependent DtxR family transcriptional regulator